MWTRYTISGRDKDGRRRRARLGAAIASHIGEAIGTGEVSVWGVGERAAWLKRERSMRGAAQRHGLERPRARISVVRQHAWGRHIQDGAAARRECIVGS